MVPPALAAFVLVLDPGRCGDDGGSGEDAAFGEQLPQSGEPRISSGESTASSFVTRLAGTRVEVLPGATALGRGVGIEFESSGPATPYVLPISVFAAWVALRCWREGHADFTAAAQ